MEEVSIIANCTIIICLYYLIMSIYVFALKNKTYFINNLKSNERMGVIHLYASSSCESNDYYDKANLEIELQFTSISQYGHEQHKINLFSASYHLGRVIN